MASLKSSILLAIFVLLTARLVASAPAPAPGLSGACPSKYTVIPHDTYCKISTKTGVSVASLMAANPNVPLGGVSAGLTFNIPCKPQQDCCPMYVYAAPEGTGLGDILVKRPDLSIKQLVAANPNNENVNATFVRCGAEVKIPCKAGSPVCAAPSPFQAPSVLPILPATEAIVTPRRVAQAPAPAPLATRRAMAPVKPVGSVG